MRLPLLLLLCAALAASAPAAEIRIVRAFTGWRDAESFKRISEYFDGKENDSGQTVLRTHPGERGGFYFLLRVHNEGAPQPVSLVLQLVLPVDAKTKTYTFTSALKTGDTVFNLGLTGDDWPDPKAHPVAWEIQVTGPGGAVLATSKSYLWEKPAKP